MKIVFLLIGIFLCGKTFLTAQETITIEECYNWAEQNYPEIERYNLIEKSEAYSISNASKSWLPQINIGAKASYQSDVTTLPLEGLDVLLPNFTVPIVSKDQYMVQAELSQKIWDGGRTNSKKEMISLESEVERNKIAVNLYSLRDRINQLYFAYLLQTEVLKLKSILQEELKNNLARVEALIINGLANQSDKELIEVEMLHVMQHIVDINTSLTMYRQMLSFMIGKELQPNITLHLPTGVETISDSVYRPELNLFKSQQEFLLSKERMLKKDLMPQFGAYVNGGYGRPALNMLDNNFAPFYVAGLRINWNIGRLYTHNNNLKNIDIERNNLGLLHDKFMFNTELSMINQKSDIKRIKEKMETDCKIVELRKSIRAASEAKFENGTLSTLDLITDINAENQAKQQLETRKIELLSEIYKYLYTTNNKN